MVDLADRLHDLPPDAGDGVIALRLADYLTETPGRRGKYYLSAIFGSRSEAKAVAPTLPHTKVRKNVVAFTTSDREAALGWIIQASLAGYRVSRAFGPDWSGGGMGTLTQIRRASAGPEGDRARDRRTTFGETEFG